MASAGAGPRRCLAPPGGARPVPAASTATSDQTEDREIPESFRLTSPDFEPGGGIPRRFTCDGDDASPPLAWEGAPDATVSFVLIVHDPDARDFVHWIVFGMTVSQTGALPEGVSASPDAPAQGINDFGRLGWGGPCPPSGVHRYVFTLYALSDVPAFVGAPRPDDVRRALDDLVIDRAVLEASYGRG